MKDYIAKHKNIRGDIVTNTDQTKYHGRWIKPREEATEIKEDFGDWELLEL